MVEARFKTFLKEKFSVSTTSDELIYLVTYKMIRCEKIQIKTSYFLPLSFAKDFKTHHPSYSRITRYS